MKPAMMPCDPFSSENSECLRSLDLLWPPGGLVTIWKTVFRMSTKSKHKCIARGALEGGMRRRYLDDVESVPLRAICEVRGPPVLH